MTLNMYRLSCDSQHNKVSIGDEVLLCDNDVALLYITVGRYVAAVYDGEWYIGMVTTRSEEHCDVEVNFMCRNSRTNVISWPSHKDECAVLVENVLSHSSTYCHWEYRQTLQTST